MVTTSPGTASFRSFFIGVAGKEGIEAQVGVRRQAQGLRDRVTVVSPTGGPSCSAPSLRGHGEIHIQGHQLRGHLSLRVGIAMAVLILTDSSSDRLRPTG